MIKVRIHIWNNSDWMDKEVFAYAEIPQIPRVGERLKLDDKILNELHSIVKSSLKLVEKYSPIWIGLNFPMERDVVDSDIEKLDFRDADTVGDVAYLANSDIVDIELNTMDSVLEELDENNEILKEIKLLLCKIKN